jgi:hypothetical protein
MFGSKHVCLSIGGILADQRPDEQKAASIPPIQPLPGIEPMETQSLRAGEENLMKREHSMHVIVY